MTQTENKTKKRKKQYRVHANKWKDNAHHCPSCACDGSPIVDLIKRILWCECTSFLLWMDVMSECWKKLYSI